jgi:hypothetical protein
MVAHCGAPPRSPVWKTGVLGDGRMSHEVAAGVGIAPTFPVLQTGANLSQLSSVKVARTTGAAPGLGPARQAGIDAVRTHAHWWPASVLPRVGRGKSPVLHLQRLRTKNGPPTWCCPKYLPVIDRLLWLVSYRREMVDPEVVATSLCQIKSLMPVYCGFESIGIRDRCSPGCLRLERRRVW